MVINIKNNKTNFIYPIKVIFLLIFLNNQDLNNLVKRGIFRSLKEQLSNYQ